jgi:hypothetical protein
VAVKKPKIRLDVAGDVAAEEAFIRGEGATRKRDAKASKRHDAESVHRTMVYLPMSLWRELRVHLAHTDEAVTSFLARATRELLEREAGGEKRRRA